jgi:hypothetical protein
MDNRADTSPLAPGAAGKAHVFELWLIRYQGQLAVIYSNGTDLEDAAQGDQAGDVQPGPDAPELNLCSPS